MIIIRADRANAKTVSTQLLTSGMVGAQVKFVFSNEWEGLRKTAVFQVDDKTIDVLDSQWDGNVCTIPNECLATSGKTITVGVYGCNDVGDLVIPTVYTKVSRVRLGADPSNDESVDSTLPVYEQLRGEMGKLSDLETVDKSNLVSAINEVESKISQAVSYGVQELTEDQQIQARKNLGFYYNVGTGDKAEVFNGGASINASGNYSHAEGSNTTASGEASHAEGWGSTASGIYSHAEGLGTKALYMCSHAEGFETTASSNSSHAEGTHTTASGGFSHAEGGSTTASGVQSHAEGAYTIASGTSSHAEGWYTIASGAQSHAQGKYNVEDVNKEYSHIVGNGNKDKRSNAHTLDWSGNGWFAGDVYVGSTSGTNKDDGSKKLATEEYVDSQKFSGSYNDLTDKPTIPTESIQKIESLDTSNIKTFRSIEDGIYVLDGYFAPYTGSDSTFIFDPPALVSISSTESETHVQIFEAHNNQVQHLVITDTSCEETYVPLNDIAKSAANSLPTVTASDNGKFLQVVDGAWTAATISNANGVNF